MDPDSFAMSSYQFVNSLASCYPQTQQHQQHQVAANQPSNDYFPANPSYNPNLYSGQPHYAAANQNYLAATQQQQQQSATDSMVDYTQLQPQRMMQHHQQAAVLPAANANPTPSCKFVSDQSGPTPIVNPAPGSIASPQDLSTARDIISPKLSPNTVENVTRSLNNKNNVSSSTAQLLNPANNNNNNSTTSNNNTNNNNNNSNHTTSVGLNSPTDSDSSSESGGEESAGGRGSGQNSSSKKGSGPPQIYPWMKRVHLGQSEYRLGYVKSYTFFIYMPTFC